MSELSAFGMTERVALIEAQETRERRVGSVAHKRRLIGWQPTLADWLVAWMATVSSLELSLESRVLAVERTHWHSRRFLGSFESTTLRNECRALEESSTFNPSK